MLFGKYVCTFAVFLQKYSGKHKLYGVFYSVIYVNFTSQSQYSLCLMLTVCFMAMCRFDWQLEPAFLSALWEVHLVTGH